MFLLWKYFALGFSALLPLINPLGSALIFLGLVGAAPIDIYRRSLQKVYIETLDNLVNPTPPMALPAGLPRGLVIFTGDIKNTDIPSIARAQLVGLRGEITAAIPKEIDKVSKYHLQDVLERIKQALNPKETNK